MAKRKRPRCWYQTAGTPPFTVAVREKTPGGVIYGGAYDPERQGYRWRSLATRDRAEALAWAQREATALGAGADALRLPSDGPTVAGLLALYVAHKIAGTCATCRGSIVLGKCLACGTVYRSRDGAVQLKRRVDLWTSRLGARKVSSLTADDYRSFIRDRMNGIIDADGNLVTVEKDRRTVRARVADKDAEALNSAMNWGRGYLVNGRRLVDHNPWGAPAPGTAKPFKRVADEEPMRPIATYDRYLALRARSDEVTMRVRGRAVRSYIGALLDLVEDNGRRITAVLRLAYDDVRWEAKPNGGMRVVSVRWPALKGETRRWVPVSPKTAAVLEAEIAARPGIGPQPLFPAPNHPERPVSGVIAWRWLSRNEDLAGLSHLEGGGFHPFRRKWATERKHLPDADVMAVAGWRDPRALKTAYQQPDGETILAVVNEPRKLRDRKAGA